MHAVLVQRSTGAVVPDGLRGGVRAIGAGGSAAHHRAGPPVVRFNELCVEQKPASLAIVRDALNSVTRAS